MNKININATKPQIMTAEEINAIAQHILNRKGDVDMSSCNVTITPPSGMSAGMAGIIVKCAEESGGTVVINRHTEIDTDTYNYLVNGKWWILDLISAGVPPMNISSALSIDSNISLSRKLVSNSQQIINTGVSLSASRTLLLEGLVTSGSMFGETPHIDSNDCYIRPTAMMINYTSGPRFSFDFTSNHVIEVTTSGVNIDGISQSTTAHKATNPMTLFYGAFQTQYGTAKIKRFAVWEGSTCLLYLLPCKKDGVCGMLNLMAEDVTADSAFFTNQGTGDFTIE